MTNTKNSGKRARKNTRKIDVKSGAINAPVLAIEFHASEPEKPEINETITHELVVVAPENAQEQDVRSLYLETLMYNFAERVRFELSKNAESCADKYKKYAREICNERVANVFFDAKVTPDFVNRSERAGYRFNEKTTMRMRDIARFLLKVDSLTNYTRAIFSSVFAFNKAGVRFTSHHAFACCSASDRRFRDVEHLMTHTQEIYGETTQQAQHSMSLNALVEMHALIELRTGKTSEYKINPESYVAQALITELQLS